MQTIENDSLRVTINPTGAELIGLFNKHTGLEYLWSGDAKFWGKHSPILFPIVGTLKDNSYFFDDKKYELGRHGFAREKLFSVKTQTDESVTFELQSDKNTLAVFPFAFVLSISYTIAKNSLSVKYSVTNPATKTLYFSVGGHPAFKLPLSQELQYEDYFLLFNKKEDTDRWPISADGLIEAKQVPLLQNTNVLPLSKSLFYKDAIVLKDLQSDEVELKSDKDPAGFRFSFKGFPYLGIWAAKNADFICIEPWCGIADNVDANQSLTDKEGIIALPAGDHFERTWSVTTW